MNTRSRKIQMSGENWMSARRGLRWILTLACMHLLMCVMSIGSANAAETIVEPGIDRPGGDYKNFDLEPSIAGFGPCKSACESDGSCQAWTFVKSGVQGPKARCWLKGSVPAVVRNNCCVSGVKPVKPIKNMPGSGPVIGSALGPQILAFALRQLGKCVDSKGKTVDPCPPLAMGAVGEGECTHLVQAALASVGAKFTSGSYLWGTPVGSVSTGGSPRPGDYQPGDIIQLFNAKLTSPNGWWETSSQHSAIIESVNGSVLNIIQQNTWADGKNLRYVTRGTINLNWKLERGSYIVYRSTK